MGASLLPIVDKHPTVFGKGWPDFALALKLHQVPFLFVRTSCITTNTFMVG